MPVWLDSNQRRLDYVVDQLFDKKLIDTDERNNAIKILKSNHGDQAIDELRHYFIKLYDIEKTVCDIMRLRNKIGIDIANEVLKNYLKRPNRNIAKLNEYARQLHISTVLSNFLTILLWKTFMKVAN